MAAPGKGVASRILYQVQYDRTRQGCGGAASHTYNLVVMDRKARAGQTDTSYLLSLFAWEKTFEISLEIHGIYEFRQETGNDYHG